jgi:eukaryotic-like serine/threonine-protein kinase
MPIPDGTGLGRYEIRSKIGEGGMGEVYLAQDTQLDRTVALKILPAAVASDQQRMRRFIQEAKAVSALNHPNILTIHEIGQADSVHFIAAEFIDGLTLRRRINSTQMTIGDALKVAIQVADALSAAHEAGIVHRDIKPENVMVRRDGYVKVLDFGLAKLTERKAATVNPEALTKTLIKTEAGVVVGTVIYMSPEQARGQDVDARTDIWSLGVVLYEMVAGRLPFEGSTSSEILAAVLSEKEQPLLARYSREAPAELERIVTKALRKDREQRYQTVKDLALDLKRLKQGLEFQAEQERSVQPNLDFNARATRGDEQPAAGHPAAPTTDDARWRKILTARWALAVAALVTLGVVSFYALMFRGAPPVSQPQIKSLAVLPLENLSGDPTQNYFADGMTEALITELAQIGELRVISRTSVMQYKGARKTMPEIARELSVDAVVEGSVQRSGERVQITAQLIRAATDQHLWAKSYERDLRDVLSLQREVARGIADEIRVKVSPQEQKRLASGRPVQRNALEAYLRGRDYFNQGIYGAAERELLEKSIGYYEQAINIDPGYAPAYAGLARSYHWLATGDRAPELFPKAKEAALKALQLDETLAEAHGALALTIMYLDWDLAGAEREYKRAIELNPSYSEAHHGYALYLILVGRLDEAIREIEQAETLDPLVKQLKVNKAWIYTRARQYGRAIEQLQSLGSSQDPWPHQLLGSDYIYRREYERGLAEMQKAVELSAGSPDSKASLAWAYATANRKGEAIKLLNELKDPAQPGTVQPISIALIYTALGDKEQAFVWLEKGYQAHTEFFLDNINSPDFESLHSDPRFQNIMQRIGWPQRDDP